MRITIGIQEIAGDTSRQYMNIIAPTIGINAVINTSKGALFMAEDFACNALL